MKTYEEYKEGIEKAENKKRQDWSESHGLSHLAGNIAAYNAHRTDMSIHTEIMGLMMQDFLEELRELKK